MGFNSAFKGLIYVRKLILGEYSIGALRQGCFVGLSGTLYEAINALNGNPARPSVHVT